MFAVLDELDKLLERVGLKRKQRQVVKVTLDDIKRIDVDKLDLEKRVQYPAAQIHQEMLNQIETSLPYLTDSADDGTRGRRRLTTNSLFISLMQSLLLSRLVQLPERDFASARLMICDRESHEAIMKLQRIASLKSDDRRETNRSFIYKRPFNLTAILLLQDIVDQFDRVRRPIVKLRRNASGQLVGTYDYSIIKQIFPYLKMTDLIIVLNDISDLRARVFDPNGDRATQILQFLIHFARTSHLVEMQSITRQIGRQHKLYDNVAILWPQPTAAIATNTSNFVMDNIHLRPPRAHLSFLAHRLIVMSQRLNLSLQSISYRSGDPSGLARVFSQIVASDLRPITNSNQWDTGLVPARVLVLDRFFDLQGLVSHSNRYGAFVEQEVQQWYGVESVATVGSRSDFAFDELDERLQAEELTGVLGAILRSTVSLRPQVKPTTTGSLKPFDGAQLSPSSSATMSASQSIRRHLDRVRLIYRRLNEGYLLMLNLEASLESIMNQLRTLEAPLERSEQEQLVARLRRIEEAFKQLVRLSGQSIKPLDLIRVACILIDVINVFIYIHSRAVAGQQAPSGSGACSTALNVMRTSLLSGKELQSLLGSRGKSSGVNNSAKGLNSDGSQKSICKLLSKLSAFDTLSRACVSQRATLKLEQIIEKFHYNQLDGESYPSLSLSAASELAAGRQTKVIVLVILGSLSCDELSRLKVLESELRQVQQLQVASPTSGSTGPASGRVGSSAARSQAQQSRGVDILLLASGLTRPEDFFESL